MNRMPTGVIRVLVVDDSVFMRTMLKSALADTEGIEVIGSAQNGLEGLKKIDELNPDVVTLDVEMPGMTGLEVLERVMKERPLPIIMVSTKTQEGARTTLEALRLGAVDCVAKPLRDKSSTLETFREDVVTAVKTAAQCNRRTLGQSKGKVCAPQAMTEAPSGALVAIGISAGGPATLHQLMPAFPAGFPPIVITQHMPADFTGPFAQRLSAEAKIEVREAADNMELRNGLAIIARGDRHLRIQRKGVRLVAMTDQGPKVSGFRPSVDVMFESVAKVVGARAVGVVMTGMGCDGANGVRILKEHGATTIAQDQATSVVYGMPKAAAETGCVDHIAPLDEIPQYISRALCETVRA